MSLAFILLLAAFIVFVIAAFPIPTKVNLVAVGLALVVAAQLFAGAHPLL